jgi:serine/threonine-protein kinase
MLEELLGAGGMSSVYRAHDQLLERDVALKVLHATYREDEEAIARFRREAQAVAQLSHPKVVTVIDRGEEDGHQFIVFEYVPGITLKDHLAQEGPLPVDEALRIAIDVGEGLAYAHGQGIVHRDVKPQNVILNGNAAKVTDFGIARSVDVEKEVTQSGTVIGTGDYIAPEQASGGQAVPASDVYGLGCVLFELLTGSPPFSGNGFVDVAMQHIHSPPPQVRDQRPDVPPRVAAAVDRALVPLGFPPEGRPFQGHLTIGRVRSPRAGRALAAAIEAAGTSAFGSWTASEVVLYESRLKPTGAVYTPVSRHPLRGVRA